MNTTKLRAVASGIKTTPAFGELASYRDTDNSLDKKYPECVTARNAMGTSGGSGGMDLKIHGRRRAPGKDNISWRPEGLMSKP